MFLWKMHPVQQIAVALVVCASWVSICLASQTNDTRQELPSCSTSTSILKPQFFPQLQSTRVKISYGPFTVPSRSADHGMRDFVCAPQKPCDDCTIVWMQAGIEYTDGSDASAENGMWLHHVVFQNFDRQDPMCLKRRSERFFASGNERTAVDLAANGRDQYGYVFRSDDRIAFQFEAMNMEQAERDVVLTVTWEYIPSVPGTFQPVQPYWFDIGGCGSSEVPAQPDAVFSYSSPLVKAPTSGLIAYAGGHLHDGGTHLELMKQGEPYCVTTASYENGHITKMSTCEGLPYRKGDDFSIIAHYNTSKHDPMAHPDGELEPVMGIAILYAVKGAPSRDRNNSHSGTVIGLVVLFLALVAIGVGFLWFRSGKDNVSDAMRDWLSRYTNQARNGPSETPRTHSTGPEDQESLLNDLHTDLYQD